MLFDEERAETYDCGKVCSKMQKRLSRGKQVPSEEVG